MHSIHSIFRRKLIVLILMFLSSLWLLSTHALAQEPAQQVQRLFIDKAGSAYRDLFAACARKHYPSTKSLSNDAIHKLMYLPVALSAEFTLNRQSGAPTVRDRLRDIDSRFRRIDPASYYLGSKQVPINSVGCASPKRELLTIVIIPGIFSEFSQLQPFAEYFGKSNRSIGHRKWQRALSRLSATDSRRIAKSYVANLRPHGELREQDVVFAKKSIEEVVWVSSVSNRNKQELARLVLLRSHPFSAETLGTLKDSSQVYIERLNKYFSVMGRPRRIVFIGYSRGGPVALQILSDARKQGLPWLKKVEATVSLAGVVWGTSIADNALDNKKSRTYRLLAKMKKLAKALDIIDRKDVSFDIKLQTITAAYLKFSTVFIKGDGKGLGFNPVKNVASIDRKAITRLLRDFTKKHVKLLKGNNKYKNAKRDYANDVRKFRSLLNNIIVAIEGLSTRQRVRWFRQNTLPNRVRYLTIAASMADAPLGNNQYAYNSSSIDHRALTLSWRHYTRISNIAFNDSQVSVNRTIFWPQLMRTLKQNNKTIRSEMLGIAGTHHWALVIPRVGSTASNPFPRKAMLLALIHYLNANKL